MAYVQFGIIARLSYPVLFEPRSYQDDPTKKKEYSCDLLIPKSDIATYKRIEDARKQAVKETWSAFNTPNFEALYSNLITNMGPKKGFFCGDIKAQNNEKYADVYSGHWYLKATNLQQPILLDRQRNPIGEHNKDIFYAGCLVKALLSVGGYESSGKGLRNTLRGLQFFQDGTRWSGSVVARVSEFENLDAPNKSMEFDKVLETEEPPF